MAIPSRSTLHLQLGQETIYLIMAVAVFAAIFLAALAARPPHKVDDPPMIRMSEADGYYFPTGSSEISVPFRTRLLEEVVPKLSAAGKDFDARIIEVVGHTDQIPLNLSRRYSANLDMTLDRVLNGDGDARPVAADNVGLGMARAVAVSRVLRSSPAMKGFDIMPLSAGAFERVDDTASRGDAIVPEQERRRIDIRLRRQTKR